MRPSFIITASPLFDHHSGLGQAAEYFSIQAFLPECAVKTFAAAVLPRLPWLNIGQDRITRSRLAGDPADVLLSPRLAQIGMLEFHRAAEAIEEGEDCVQKSLEEIRQVTGKQ